MVRPNGALRTAVLAALRDEPGTLLDIAERSQIGYTALRYTVQDAVRSGVLQICGQERRAHSKRWLSIYELVPPQPAPEPTVRQQADRSGLQVLSSTLGCWGREPI